MSKRKNNVDFVCDLMEDDPMAQLLIVDAITKHAELIIGMGRTAVVEALKDNWLVDGDAWFDAAQRVHNAVKERSKR